MKFPTNPTTFPSSCNDNAGFFGAGDREGIADQCNADSFHDWCEWIDEHRQRMIDDPRDYDREFTTRVHRRARRRLGIDVDRGQVKRFVVQLEYLVDPHPEVWEPVVRYDHDAGGGAEATHDVTEEGLHIDIYRNGAKIDSHELTPPLPANDALNAAEEHLAEHLDGYIRRFERWHEINP